jgi:hypothetical protein
VKHEKAAEAVVGQGYITPERKTKGDWMTLLYGQGSSHNKASKLGLGISGYGLDAGYSSGGTNTSTATHGASFPGPHHSAWFRTEFKTAQFRGTATC